MTLAWRAVPIIFLVVLHVGCAGAPRSGPRREANPSPRDVAPVRAAGTGPEDTPAEPAPFTGGELTLPAAIELALAGNPDLQIALERTRQAAARRREVTSVFLPVVGLEAEYLRGDAPSSFFFKAIDARKLDPGTDFNDPGTFDNFETGFSARYNLFNGGRDVLERQIALADVEMARLNRQAIQNELVASVIFAYHDVLMAGSLLETARQSVETVRRQLREAQARREEGRTLRSDVLSLEVRLAEARERRIRADSGRRLALAALASVLGLRSDVGIELSGGAPEATVIPDDYERGLGEALLERPELENARRALDRATLRTRSARRAFLPRVDAQARAYWDDPDAQFATDRTNWLVGFALSWNLFEGGGRLARVEQARAYLRQMKGADRKQMLAVELDVKRAYLKLEEATARLAVTETNVARAAETLSLVRSQYEEGSATVTRYLEAELDLTRARMRQATARFDRRKATSNVARALGRFARPADGE